MLRAESSATRPTTDSGRKEEPRPASKWAGAIGPLAKKAGVSDTLDTKPLVMRPRSLSLDTSYVMKGHRRVVHSNADFRPRDLVKIDTKMGTS